MLAPEQKVRLEQEERQSLRILVNEDIWESIQTQSEWAPLLESEPKHLISRNVEAGETRGQLVQPKFVAAAFRSGHWRAQNCGPSPFQPCACML